jgi:hypothetical protein
MMFPICSIALAALLAQAEPAPPEPGAGPPPAVDPGPAAAPPADGPGEAAPPSAPESNAPGALLAPAPTPAPSPAPNVAPDAAGPSLYTASLLAGFAYRLTSDVGPAAGFTLGGSFERRYAAPAPGLQLGVAVDFLFDQFSQGVQGTTADASGADVTFSATRTITDTSFAALQTLSLRVDRVRVWAGAGGGLSIGYFSSPELALRPGNATAYLPMGRGVLGADLAINDHVAVGVRAAYTFMFTDPIYTTAAGQSFHLFGDLLDIHAGFFYRFQ